jgi:hypothetical protein
MAQTFISIRNNSFSLCSQVLFDCLPSKVPSPTNVSLTEILGCCIPWTKYPLAILPLTVPSSVHTVSSLAGVKIKYAPFTLSINLFQLASMVTFDIEARSIKYLDLLYPVLISILDFVPVSSVVFLFVCTNGSRRDTATSNCRRRSW